MANNNLPFGAGDMDETNGTGRGSSPALALLGQLGEVRNVNPTANKWFFSKELLDLTPSRRFKIDPDKELAYRQQSANFIQDMGQRLSVNQLCINTAIVYMHRFYMYHSFSQFHRYPISTAAIFLAAKVEEQPRKLEHVIRVSHHCLHRDSPRPIDVKSEQYHELSVELVMNENILLQTLGFDVNIDHPHTHVVKCCQLVRASRDLAQTSYFMATNSLHLTTMCLQHRPTVVASVCIHLACKWSNWEIPKSKEGKDWFWYVDQEVTQEQLDALTTEFLDIFNRSPSRLKKKINSLNQGSIGGASFNLSSFPSNYLDDTKPFQFDRPESPNTSGNYNLPNSGSSGPGGGVGGSSASSSVKKPTHPGGVKPLSSSTSSSSSSSSNRPIQRPPSATKSKPMPNLHSYHHSDPQPPPSSSSSHSSKGIPLPHGGVAVKREGGPQGLHPSGSSSSAGHIQPLLPGLVGNNHMKSNPPPQHPKPYPQQPGYPTSLAPRSSSSSTQQQQQHSSSGYSSQPQHHPPLLPQQKMVKKEPGYPPLKPQQHPHGQSAHQQQQQHPKSGSYNPSIKPSSQPQQIKHPQMSLQQQGYPNYPAQQQQQQQSSYSSASKQQQPPSPYNKQYPYGSQPQQRGSQQQQQQQQPPSLLSVNIHAQQPPQHYTQIKKEPQYGSSQNNNLLKHPQAQIPVMMGSSASKPQHPPLPPPPVQQPPPPPPPSAPPPPPPNQRPPLPLNPAPGNEYHMVTVNHLNQPQSVNNSRPAPPPPSSNPISSSVHQFNLLQAQQAQYQSQQQQQQQQQLRTPFPFLSQELGRGPPVANSPSPSSSSTSSTHQPTPTSTTFDSLTVPPAYNSNTLNSSLSSSSSASSHQHHHGSSASSHHSGQRNGEKGGGGDGLPGISLGSTMVLDEDEESLGGGGSHHHSKKRKKDKKKEHKHEKKHKKSGHKHKDRERGEISPSEGHRIKIKIKNPSMDAEPPPKESKHKRHKSRDVREEPITLKIKLDKDKSIRDSY